VVETLNSVSVERLKWEESDGALVRRFAHERDGEAFSIIMGRYADMVYSPCRRILGNEAQAADTVQETFFQLVKNADRIRGSLGGWLHRVATRRAIDLVRQNASRRNREQAYALEADCQGSTWAELEPVVDAALEELPDDLREILLDHLLQGKSTIQIAAARGVSQPTISRRMTEALEQLRHKMRDRGILAGLVPLQTVLRHSNHAAAEALTSGLGKVALAKAAAAHTFWSVPVAEATTGVGVQIA
jgi:RNA polymerase sigma-70 factor (ECF subfamily)